MLDTQSRDVLSVDVDLLEELMSGPEAPVSGAPLRTPPAAHIIIIGAKEPKEPKESKGR
ncbi:hypothetical protein AB0L50_09825 [Streptomyces flaveolus]|uniref:hypothetical protein n=1 Tax=Streptomyces flaveolus TaxID=67297 RepID=UPI00343553BB